MLIGQFHTGGDENLGYVVADPASRQAAIIDPSYDPQQLLDFVA